MYCFFANLFCKYFFFAFLFGKIFFENFAEIVNYTSICFMLFVVVVAYFDFLLLFSFVVCGLVSICVEHYNFRLEFSLSSVHM